MTDPTITASDVEENYLFMGWLTDDQKAKLIEKQAAEQANKELAKAKKDQTNAPIQR